MKVKRRFLLCLLPALLVLATPLWAAQPDSGQAQLVEQGAPANSGDWDSFDAEFDEDFGDKTASTTLIADPFEPVNRGMFWVNDKLYFYLFKPVAKGYRFILPHPVRVSVGNAFRNLATPIRATNSLLQLNFEGFAGELVRFVVNSTVGIAGLFDPAEAWLGVKANQEDFGQTLGHYGAGHGFYLVLPVIGPSSLRDTLGQAVDAFADPLHYVELSSSDMIWIRSVEATNRLSLDRETYEGIVRDSLDPYLFIRTAYAQRRQAQVSEDSYNLNLFQKPLYENNPLNPFD